MESESKEPLAVRKYYGDDDDALANHNSKTTIDNSTNNKVESGTADNSVGGVEISDNNHQIISNDNSEATTLTNKSDAEKAIAIKNNENNNNNSNKGKITHRSQSSPSSLTTHKFGLRPTPSPPRLIIDHKTGDIIESYPEQPVYLKTYQPLEDEEDDDDSQVDDCTFDDSLAHPYPPPLNNQRQLEEYNRLLAEQYGGGGGHPVDHLSTATNTTGGGYISSEEFAAMSNRNNSYRPAIPPPHSANNKVYFAPPVSSAGHLFGQTNQPYANQLPHQMTDPFDSDHHQPYRSQQQHQQQLAGGHPATGHPAATSGQQEYHQEPLHHQISGSHNSSFKRALNKLNGAANTDIAIMTDLPGAEYGVDAGQPATGAGGGLTGRIGSGPNGGRATNRASGAANPIASGGLSNFKVTATSASKGKALLATQGQQLKQQQPIQKQQQQQQQQHRIVPAIEDFNLYDFCFNFRTLLACLLSSLIIYLLVSPLSLDCTQYRPTYTYISIIVSSVNLVCIVIFTLFWYCNGVTRTLYANLSSSAFIITIYSILVAINLALAILFFFINTCHFQRLIKTSSTPLIVAIEPTTSTTQQPNIDLDQPIALPLLQMGLANDEMDPTTSFVALKDNNYNYNGPPGSYPMEPLAFPVAQPTAAIDYYSESPVEAAWEYIKGQVVTFKRKFNQFLQQYDLRFIGALHALCAICLQYMAMKVAVVRSYFCSPVRAYI